MGTSLYIAAIPADELESVTEENVLEVFLAGWSADQVGWAVAGLPFGERGIRVFESSGPRIFGLEAEVMRPEVRDKLATNAADEDTIRERFRAQAFGLELPLGVVPLQEHEDWLVDEAMKVRALMIDAAAHDKTVIFTLF